MARGAGFAEQKNRHVGIAPANFLDEAADGGDGIGAGDTGLEFLIVHRQHKTRRAARLLRKHGRVAKASDAQHLRALFFNGLREGANTEPAGVVGAEIFVDDDDGKIKAQSVLLWGESSSEKREFYS